MTATAAKLTTFAELEQLPEPEGFRYELHHGELIQAPPPRFRHYAIQLRIHALLQAAGSGCGVAGPEMGFRPRPDYEYRIADVGFVSQSRWNSVSLDGYLHGAPEIVIEVLSPSNRAGEIYDKQQLCLENGCLEFWVVDPEHRLVHVTTAQGQARFYEPGDEIPLYFGGAIAVDSVFE